ncbi:MAG: 1,4-dihydroxy-2-naphthoate octaprenyltransferase, partial [Prevotella intermedia]
MAEKKDILSRMETDVKVNSLNAWILAARPKTLTGASVPIMIGIAFAFTDV